MAFVTTAAIVLGLTIFACQTRFDVTGKGTQRIASGVGAECRGHACMHRTKRSGRQRVHICIQMCVVSPVWQAGDRGGCGVGGLHAPLRPRLLTPPPLPPSLRPDPGTGHAGSYLLVLLVALVVVTLIGVFWVNTLVLLLTSGFGALVFGAFLVHDVQMLVGGRRYQLDPDEYVFAALSIYLDVVNLFLYLLQFLSLLTGGVQQ